MSQYKSAVYTLIGHFMKNIYLMYILKVNLLTEVYLLLHNLLKALYLRSPAEVS